jgi:hypothetical protein
MRFQFRLRTPFIVVTVAAFGAWFGHEYRVVQERKAVRIGFGRLGLLCCWRNLDRDQ